ncbi:MAG: substrate-binding domain-containing protein [Treponema sp.]|jgi:simple sugar transport system substrate-binding protein|nr:substrate-binding domain-containing protein [Treponema sp.]
MKKICVLFFLILIFSCCTYREAEPVEYLIGVSQADMRTPWRLVLSRELREESAKYPNIRLVFTDATDDPVKQVNDIDRLLAYGIDLLIVSPCDAEYLTGVIRDVYRRIPVIVMDRVVEGYDYSLFIGPDNELIGREMGKAIAEMAGGEERTVLELRGSSSSMTSFERSRGFRSEVSSLENLRLLDVVVENESRDSAEDKIFSLGSILKDIDIIFAHNDYMALGAHRALETLDNHHVQILGIDGFTGSDGGLELIEKGIINRSITCPTGGREAIQFSMDILRKASGVPKQVILRSHNVTKENLVSYRQNIHRAQQSLERKIRVGYAQVGTESGWRLANNKSIIEAAKNFGLDLTAIDANQSQERQIESVRKFIREKMDVIVISPVIDSGWDEVLNEAAAAGIPVLLSDRKITNNSDLHSLTFIGADFIEEGRRAMRWAANNIPAGNGNTRILEIQGTIGATPTIERKLGFEMVMEEHPRFKIVHSESGDFTTEGGRKIIEDYISKNLWNIDVIFAHNDDMAIGAVEALESAGINPGKDVKIISIDGTKNAVRAVADGKMNCVVECSPLLGEQLMKAITDLMSGKELPLRIITDEIVFTVDNAKDELKNRTY